MDSQTGFGSTEIRLLIVLAIVGLVVGWGFGGVRPALAGMFGLPAAGFGLVLLIAWLASRRK